MVIDEQHGSATPIRFWRRRLESMWHHRAAVLLVCLLPLPAAAAILGWPPFDR